jgi:hypothetical protein
MVRLLVLYGLLPNVALANEHWIRFTSGSIEVFSRAGSKDGRETLVKFEEFRHALGYTLGEDDLQLPLPIRFLLFKSGTPPTGEPVVRGCAQYNIVLTPARRFPTKYLRASRSCFWTPIPRACRSGWSAAWCRCSPPFK